MTNGEKQTCPVWRQISDIETGGGGAETIEIIQTGRINGCQKLAYWVPLQKLDLLSLQRHREKDNVLILTWTMMNGLVPKDIQFKLPAQCKCHRACISAFHKKAQFSISTQ